MRTNENEINVFNGWVLLITLLFAGLILGIFTLITVLGTPVSLVLTVPLIGLWVFLLCGFFTLQPNEAAVLVLFGAYKGTVKSPGFKWANPLLSKIKISLRARNLNGDTIKVNDSRGNPIEIAAIIVWQVRNTAKAAFDVDDYAHFVAVQSESALRHLAMAYPYDIFEGDELSLRGSTDEISQALQEEVQERIEKAGVQIIEARLSHLAYAQEIAGAMLQRQQAEAIVAARTRIVEGAMGMVEIALDRLESAGKVELDDERKAAMVTNLLVVLCGHSDAQPVINTGTLYT